MHFCVKFTTFEFSFIFKIKCKLLKFDAVVNPGKMGSIFVTNRNLGQNHVLDKNPNLGQKNELWTKNKFRTNIIFWTQIKFWTNIQILEIKIFLDKDQILDKNKILKNVPNFVQKSKFFTAILVTFIIRLL